MEETYILKENEISSDELTNKLNNGFKINELRFELDVEITDKLINNIYITIFNRYFSIIKDCICYYNNILIIIPDIFQAIYNSEVLYDNFTIILNNTIPRNELAYKQCSIKLIKDNLQWTCRMFTNENTKKMILSNYFNNMDEFKEYFIKFTNSNEIIFNKWIESRFKNNYIHKLYPSKPLINLNTIDNVIFNE